jgi:hypothetical protein
VFFCLLSLMSLVKGTGFGAVLVLSVVGTVVLWDRDRTARARLALPAGWLFVVLGTLAWPLAMVIRHGWKVSALWLMHVTERLGSQVGHGPFAGEAWPQYVLNILGQALPWVPLTLVGGCASLRQAVSGYERPNERSSDELLGNAQADRLLWAWALMPLLLVSLAGARKAQYAIYALVPWSIWSALGLSYLGRWLIVRGWSPQRLKRQVIAGLTGVAMAYGLGFWLAGPWLSRRNAEWSFYEAVERRVPFAEPIVLLYDDWDRDPYPTPFGPIPHDVAIRLYYLNRPACWHFDVAEIAGDSSTKCRHLAIEGSGSSLVILGRARDVEAIRQLGPIEILAEGTGMRWDRTYLIARLWPERAPSPSVTLGSASDVRYDSPSWNP